MSDRATRTVRCPESMGSAILELNFLSLIQYVLREQIPRRLKAIVLFSF